MPTTASQYCWDDIPKERVSDLLHRRLIWGDKAMLAQVTLDKGCLIPKHRHVHEQFTYVLSGALHFWLGEDEKEEATVRAGDVLHFPSNLPHKAEALEDTILLDVFSPPREDWIQKTDDYLRR
jgi:quercetin dioxygenase-like cupin family protein